LPCVGFDKITGIDFEVIVSDNGSTDGSVEMIKNEFPTVRIVENGINIGFAAANNRAAKIAQGKYIFLLNPDTVVLDKNISKLVEFMDKNPKIGACGPLVLNSDGTMQRQCKRGWPTFKNSFFYYSGLWKLFSKSQKWKKFTGGYFCLDKPDDQVCEVGQLSGAAMIVRRDILEKSGEWMKIILCIGMIRIYVLGLKILGLKYAMCRKQKLHIMAARAARSCILPVICGISIRELVFFIAATLPKIRFLYLIGCIMAASGWRFR